MTNLTEELLSQHHAVFEQNSNSSYVCLKDVFNHISVGAIISNQMLNCYLTLVPSAARVEIVEYDSGD